MDSVVRDRAVKDAKEMQKIVTERCRKLKIPVPEYEFLELTGKGSYGRVYKAVQRSTKRLVAIKITDIQRGDFDNSRAPAGADVPDFFGEAMKEIQALKTLEEIKAPNINHIIEGRLVGSQMWMVTEYCAGGSVKTLMRPTQRDGLQEGYAIPILREVARALKSVHEAGIIHRDLKCGNVLITEEGGVQLCDFGVSSIRESASDKRKTYVGSQHWMAPEFYRPETQRSYGSEVDIWAFGCMAYEIITGMPPNARLGIDQLWQRLQDPNKPMPRLDANKYSKDLVDLVDSCLQFRPEDRPTIQDLLKHRYLANTEDQYPTSALKDLVKAFKRWESVGNVRQSLFMPGGASGPKESEDNYTDDNSEWNFSSTLDFDEDVNVSVGDDDVRRVYGSNVDLSGQMNPEMPPEQTSGGPRRRRAPPKNLNNAVKAPLERMFDPNTVRGYKDFSDEHYFRNFVKIPEPSTPSSDLPLRKDEGPIITRTSMIDLDLDMGPGPPSSNFASFGEQQLTLRQDNSFGNSSQSGDFSVRKDRPQTQEWTFASAGQMSTSDAPSKTQNQFVIDGTIKPADRSARPRPRRVPTMAEPGEEEFKLGRGRRPSLVHAATEPTGQAFNNYRPQAALTAPNAATGRESLIDLDFGLMPTSDYTPFQSTPQSQYTPDSSRPQTAMSESESELGDKNPFELERHLQYRMSISKPPREPSLYVDDRYSTASIQSGGHLRQTSSISDLTSDAASGSESSHYRPSRSRGHATRPSESSISDAEHAPRSQLSAPFTPFRHQDMMDMSMSTDEMSLMPAMRLMNMYDDDADLEGELTNVLAAFDGEMQKTLDLFKEFVEPAPASRRSRDGAGGDEANGPPAMN